MRNADFWDVRAGFYDMNRRIHRFPGDDAGRARANAYAAAYNASLLKAMGLREEHLTGLSGMRLTEDERHSIRATIESYGYEKAGVSPAEAIPVIPNDAPLPTDYEHGF